MRSDREEIPEGFTKADADKAETMEARQKMSRMASPGCQVYWPSPYQVCGAIKDKYNSLGGPNSFLLWPTTDELVNPDGFGRRSQFQNGPIYWSAASGAHPVVNHFFAAWARNGYESGYIGYPTTDEIANPDGIGRRQEFQGAAIYWKLNEAYSIGGAIRDKWNTVGAESNGSLLGYPTSDEIILPDGQGRMNRFERGVIYWHPQFGAHTVFGEILTQWAAEGYEGGPAGYPVEDQRQISPTGVEQMFQNATHAWPRRISDDYCGSICTDAIYNTYPQLRGFMDLISQLGAPACDMLPPPVEGEGETFYECFDPTPAIPPQEGGELQRSPQARSAQPNGSILPAKCYDKPPATWLIERHYSCVYLDDLNGHVVKGNKGQLGGKMNYEDIEISVTRADSHGRKVDVEFRAIPKLSGLGAKSILEVYPKCREIAGNSCSFSPIKGWQQIYTDEPVEFSWTTTFDAPASGTVTAPQIYLEMEHVSTGGTPVDSYKPAALPYEIGEAPILRCDNYIELRGSDCIFTEAMPALNYGPEKNLPEISWHIYKAQKSGLPGASENFPLHRATEEERARTRKISCPFRGPYPSPRPPHTQCDEYPFAASREGAQLGGVGSERTHHPDCGLGIAIPQETGPDGYSVCILSGAQNASAGSAIQVFHRRFRVGTGESYIVKTYPGVAPVPAK